MPIIQYWDAPPRPGYIAELLETFRERNPQMRHLVFDEVAAEELIAEHFTAREVAAFRACGVPAMRADYLRYCAVLALGGVYADVGFRCRRSLQALIDATGGGLLLRQDPEGFLINGFFLFNAAGHPLLRLALDVATANIERRPSQRVQMVTGPWIFSALWVLLRLGEDDALRRDAMEHGIERLAEPFVREAASMAPTPAGRKAIPPMVEPLFEAVGEYGRIAAAFEGVRIAPLETVTDLIDSSPDSLPYKRGETYWINWQRDGRTIFR
jgi:Glycosyltransferase sugar-binding region containing DXD motif